jgi:hypothetical protein
MNHIKTFESFVNESSYADRSMMISADQKDQILDLLKKANLQVKLSQPPEYGGDYEIEFRTPQEALKGEQVLSVLDESKLNELDMSKDYDGFVVQPVGKTDKWKFRYTKGNNRPQEDAAIKKVMAETGQSRSNFWVNDFIKKGEWDNYVAAEI